MSLPICTDSCRIWMPNFLVLSNYSSVYLPKLPCLNTFSMSDSEYRQYDPTSYSLCSIIGFTIEGSMMLAMASGSTATIYL